jgi:hypothetical protein
MKKLSLVLSATLALFMTACNTTATPEEVTREFINAMADGECEKALELTVDKAKETVETHMETGCEKEFVEIQNLTCEAPEDGTITCNCTEIRTNKEQKLSYTLKEVEGEWKVSNLNKDVDMRNFRIGGKN